MRGHIQQIINYIKTEPEEVALRDGISDYYNQAIYANVRHGVNVIKQSEPILRDFVKSDTFKVVGMLYDIESGDVEIIDQEEYLVGHMVKKGKESK